MSSKPKPTTSKLNSFFKFKTKETTLHETLRLDSARPSDPIDANEIVQQLLPGSNSLQSRLRTLDELSGIVQKYPFQHISELWVAVQDLLEAGVPHNARKAAWTFMTACIRGQFEDLGMLRAIFYQTINNHEIWEDFDDKLLALQELTKDGRDVYGFEKNIVRLLAHWIASSFDQAKVAQHMSQQRQGMQKSTTSLASLSSTPHLILLQKPIPHFNTTMALLINVVKFNFVFFDELEIANLLDLLHTICINAPEDTPHTIGFLDVIVRYGYVPSEGLSTFLKILCHTTLSDHYRDQAWAITVNLMKSHSAHNAIRLLCLNLRSKTEPVLTQAHVRVLQGSIRLLQRSLWGSTPIDTLSVSYSTVLWSLKSAVDFKSKDVDEDIIRSLRLLLETHSATLGDLEYEVILDILERLVALVKESAVGDAPSTTPFIFGVGRISAGPGHQPHPSNSLRDAYGKLLFQFIELYSAKSIPGITGRLMHLLASLQDHLPEETILLLLDYYHTEHQFYPYTPNWLERLRKLVHVSVIREKRSRIRSKALATALDVYESSMEFFHDSIITNVFMDAFERLGSETDSALSSQLTALLINATRMASEELFPMLLNQIIDGIRCTCHVPKQPPAGVPQQQSLVSRLGMSSSLSSNAPMLAHPPGPHVACRSLATAIGAIELFQHALYDPNGASRVDTIFSLLVGLAINQDVHRATRLVILDFLLCLRVDLDHRIFCSDASSIESIVAATEQLVSEETRQDRERPPTANANSRGTSSQLHAIHLRQPLGPATCHPTYNWKPFMQGRTMQASPYVISYLEITSSSGDKTDDANPAPLVGCAKVILNIPLYFTGILSILEQEKDFEIYSFVIHRLPSQLFNKHLFCNSSEQICKLRTLLVEITTKDKIPESLRNLPLSAKRQNIHILAYRVLVILLCYNNKFDAGGCRDLVNAFVSGLQRQATCAKICIHALVVCCFELPQSMTKHLPATVQMMSQIMSTATISVHILEFLSTVARLPMLYSNFVEDDYRRVFGIALKYIQYTQSIAASPSSSTPSSAASSPNATPLSSQTQLTVGARALPQYVLIMAYQVIDVWFMLQRLAERRKYVPYITRNLLMASEQGRRVDEQTETCLDMLARYSFANCGPKPKPSLMQQLLIGPSGKNVKLTTKTWLQGTSFITVRTAQNVGWAEVTVRRASGTVSFLLKIENDMFMDSSDDLDITSLPSLIRLQEDALAIESAEQSRRPSASERDPSTELPLETDARQEEAQHLAAVSGLQQRLNEVRPSWLSPRSTPHHTPLHTPLHSPLHTPRQTPHHTPKASPLPSGDNTPSSSPPLRSFMNAIPSKLTFEAGHHRVQTAPTEHVAVFSSPSMHPLHDSSGPVGHSQDDGSGDVDIRESRPAPHIDPATFSQGGHFSSSSATASVASTSISTAAAGVMANLGRSKSASENTGASQKTGVKHAELSRGPLGGALEQTKSLLSHSVGNIRREDVRRSISLASSRNNSITATMGRAQRFVLSQDDHRPQAMDGNTEGIRSFSKAKMETFVDPSFVFMQMTSYPDPLARDVPFLLADDDATNRALGVLDRTPVVDFHKIGVLYVGKGQSKEGEILSNTHGSSEYTKFLTGLGSLVRLKNSKIYAGGLDLEMDFDGKYAYSHQDEITQMIFHVATMMPNYPHDVNYDGKKRHIGNDWVTIVFNESGSDYDFGTISGQFNFMTVVVTPVSMASITSVANVSRLNQQYQQQQQQQRAEGAEPWTTSSSLDDGTAGATPSSSAAQSTYPSGPKGIVQPSKNVWFKVVMLRRPDMPEIGPLATPKIVSASELAGFTRQMALHANIYAQVYYQHLQNRVEYVSNWQERLRQIKRVKERLVAAAASTAPGAGSGLGQGGAGGVGTGGGAGLNNASSTPAGAGGGPGSRAANSGGSSGSGPSGGNNANMGLGLGMGLGGIGSASMSLGATNSGGQGAMGGTSNTSGGQQQSGIMSLEPMLDFTRYA